MGTTFPTYESIGVRPLINCRGTYTIISGSLSLPEVKAAMEAASKQYVHLDELMEKVGERIGEVMGCEFGLVTNGCAGRDLSDHQRVHDGWRSEGDHPAA